MRAAVRFCLCVLLVAACASDGERVGEPAVSGSEEAAASSPVTVANSAPVTVANPAPVTVATPAPTVASPAPVSVPKDVVYATSSDDYVRGAGHQWKLDIHSPGDGAGLPVIVLLHGFAGSKERYSKWSEQIAANGALVYTVDAPVFRTTTLALENGRGFRAISEVLGCAIGYARATAGDFGGDSDRVVLVAHSWGSLYGAWFALASDSLPAQWEQYAADQGGPAAQADCEVDSSSHVDAFVGVGGGRYADVEYKLQDSPGLAQLVSPLSYLDLNPSLPVRLLLGNDDLAHATVGADSSPAFNEALLEAGYDSELIVFDGGHIVPSDVTYETVIGLTDN